MNMIVSPTLSATPNGTTRPQVRIVIVGHVDHGKSTLVGRLLHETGSLPEGKLEMLKAVSARRGMPFEWSFLLDALQTERDQGITIDTTQIRFRTRSRDVVLIDAPGHAEFLRNMITGASQADGAVLIIDALEGVRDQTRRHGYLLHLLGIRHSPHNPRTRSSVIDDLLIHDIDLALDLLGGSVTSVSGGHWVSPDGVEELADCTMVFDHGAVATLSSSRVSQRKVRSLSLSSADLLVEIDLLRHDLTTFHHRSGEVVDRDGPIYRAETVVEIPFVRHTGEPLAVQFDHFVDLVEGSASRDAERATLRAPHAAVARIKEALR